MMAHRTHRIAKRRSQSGFSIIEVLVAMLVLAIGLLGLAALQAQGLRFNHDAYIRTQATHLASDIIDRMRTNRANIADYRDADPGGACDPAAATVSNDLTCWYDALAFVLPSGNGAITDNGADNFYDVTVRWLDRTPRDFGGTVKAPTTSGECASVAGRFWDGANCLVQQTWTVWP